MRRTVLAVSLAAFSLLAWLTPHATAQETKSARGTVTAIVADSITVKAGDRELKFTVDDKTTITATGAGTAARAATAAGKAGPKLGELLKVGDAVEVSYHEMTGSLHAASVRRVPSAGPGGGTTSDQKTETATGTVDAVTATSLSISGSRSGGTFKQTFMIDSATRVVGEGAGTAAAAKGGKFVITDYLGIGDRVSVSFRAMSDGVHATEVRVTQKAKK